MFKSNLRNLCGFVLLSITSVNAQQGTIQLEDIWGSPKLYAKKEGGFSSMNNGDFYTNTAKGSTGTCIVKYAFATGKAIDTLLQPNQLISGTDTVEFTNYSFSPDENLVLLSANTEAIYRHSSRSDYYVLNRKTGNIRKISVNGKMMYCTFSPTNDKLAYVRDNNLFYFNLADGKETAITTDGKKNEIINGATDWVYEEEFSMDVAFQWSPDGKKIAFYKFDESHVKEFNLTYYGELYPREEKYKYPKAGEDNSKVDIYIANLASGKTIKAETGTEREYIPRIRWTNDANTLSIQRSNRHQNVLELLLCNANDGTSKVILKEENKSFIEITDDLTFLSNGKQFIWTSARNGYNHIYLYNIDGSLVKQITDGKFEVTHYYGFDESTGTFYYQSTEMSPTEKNIYSITLSGKKTNLTTARGVHEAEFSVGCKYFVDTYSSFGNPFTCTVVNNKGKSLRVLEDNRDMRAEMQKFHFGKYRFFSFKTADQTELLGWMILPPDFDSTKTYPVLFNVYGGPGVQTVTNDWDGPNYLWHQLLAQKGYIIVSVDNRGTPGRGIDFANCIYKDMGKLEVDDQVAAANYMKSLPYVNKDRVGVWGWSFGGYMTSLLMTKVNTVYKTGIAVAPVINWRFYDNIYTERYLQTPQENADGYDKNSPITYAKQLKGNFMLIHGSADDNVHMQNSMDFVNALVKNNKQFDIFIYPNRNHGISGGGARLHLYTKMTNFILNNL
jgi:dipeptidyl-peptidase-4